jgi:hypothetical protein
MNRSHLFFIWLAAMLGAACVHVGPHAGISSFGPFSETQPCSIGTCAGTAPTSTASGMNIHGMDKGFRLVVCAASGQTLSGAGTMQLYLCSKTLPTCAHNKELDRSVNISGERCQAWADFLVGAPPWEDATVEAVASGVTVSGGVALSVFLFPGINGGAP